MGRIICGAVLAVGLLASGSVADARKTDSKGDDLVAVGEPLNCVPLNQIRNTRVRSNSVIDFEMSGGTVYRNTLPNSCPSLGFEQRFSYRTSLSQLCSVDIITVLQTAGGAFMPGASCGLGKFQKMQKPAK